MERFGCAVLPIPSRPRALASYRVLRCLSMKRASPDDACEETLEWVVTRPEKAKLPSVVHAFTKEELKQRDPEGNSVFSGKLRMLQSRPVGQQIPWSPKGPKERSAFRESASTSSAADVCCRREMMSPALIEYVFRYVATGSLEVQISRCLPVLGVEGALIEVI